MKMAELQRTPVPLERRQIVFQVLEQNMYNTEILQINLPRMMLQVMPQITCCLLAAMMAMTSIAGGLVSWGAWRYVPAIIGSVVAGIAGLCIAFFPYELLDRLMTKRRFREIKGASSEKLWKRINRNRGFWTRWDMVALAQLAARDEDISGALPDILRQLELNDGLWIWRRHAWDVLRLLFFDEAEVIATYDPKASEAECREKVSKLRELLGPIATSRSDRPSQPSEGADTGAVPD
jgi:hypothetical protein